MSGRLALPVRFGRHTRNGRRTSLETTLLINAVSIPETTVSSYTLLTGFRRWIDESLAGSLLSRVRIDIAGGTNFALT